MTTIFALTNDQVLSATILPRVACDNSNTVRLHVDFCAKWDGYTKSAVFYTSKDPTPYEVLFSPDGNATVPAEVLAEAGRLFVGVKGVNAGTAKVKSSTLLSLKILPGTPSMIVSDPAASVYAQLLTAYSGTKQELAVERARINGLMALPEGSTTNDARLEDICHGANGVTYDTPGDAVREQVSALDAALLVHFVDAEFEGSVAKAIVMNEAWNFSAGNAPTIATPDGGVRARTEILRYWKSIEVRPADGYNVSVLLLDSSKTCISETGWTSAATIVNPGAYFALNIKRANNTALDAATISGAVIIKGVSTERPHAEVLDSVSVEYGRTEGASYTFLRIPYQTNSGKAVRPVLTLTSADGTLAGAKRSPLTVARSGDYAVMINAGLFNVTNYQPVGQTIIGGVSVVDEPMHDDNGYPISDAECYPLCIDANGMLSAPYARNVSTADMIADGVAQAITGWGKLVENFAVCNEDIDAEIVHPGPYIRQCIGQYQNGDYCVLTVDQSRGAVENEAGLSYAECAQILVDKGVKFAYSLDGGGSAATVLGKRQLNPVYEGTTGRAVPTIISFEIQT